MRRSSDRILTTHTGSLIRPLEVVDIIRNKVGGHPLDTAAEETLARATSAVVAKQVGVGIDVPGDGEYSKSGFSTYITDRLDGFTPVEGVQTASFRGRDRDRFPDAYAELDAQATLVDTSGRPALVGGVARAQSNLACTSPIRYIGLPQLTTELETLRVAVGAAGVDEAFYTATAPGTIALQRPNRYYPSDDDYLLAVADAMAIEYRTIVESGFILQIDDPRAVTAYDAMDPAPTPEEYRRFLQIRVEALNHALAGLPADRIRYHVCWGSWHGPHTTDIELKHIINTILTIHAQAYVLEAANARHAHEYRVFEEVRVPADTIIIPGVVTHATNIVEHPALVADRIIRYAELLGPENVMAGTDCGFAQSYSVKRVPESVQWEKLRMLSEGARLASERLWRRS